MDFDNGTGTNTSGDLTFYDDSNGCFSIFSDDGMLIFKICDGGGVGGNTGSGSGSGSGGSGGTNEPTFTCRCPNGIHISSCSAYNPPPAPPYIHTPFTPRAPTGPGYTPNNNPNGTTGNTGTIGGGGGNGQYNPPPIFIPFTPPPPPPMPHQGMYFEDGVWYFPPPPADPGVSWGNDWGDGIPRDADGNIIEPDDEEEYIPTPDEESKLVELRKIMRYFNSKRTPRKNAKAELRLAKTLHNLKQKSPLVQKICDRIQTKLATVPTVGSPSIRINISETRNFDDSGKTDISALGIPFIKTSSGEAVFLEELIHALQYLERNSTTKPDKNEQTHNEFEAKIIVHMILTVKGGTEMWVGQRDRPMASLPDYYQKWVGKIKSENLTQFNSTGEFTLIEWQKFIRLFAHPDNHDEAYNFLNNPSFAPPTTQMPVVLFFLFQP